MADQEDQEDEWGPEQDLPDLANSDSDEDEHRPGTTADVDDSDTDEEQPSNTVGATSTTSGSLAGMANQTIKAWDWLLSDKQLSTWREAEAVANCSFKPEGNNKQRRWKRSSATCNVTPSGTFTTAAAYHGHYIGYKFQTGDEGTGYYADNAGANSTTLAQSTSHDSPSTTTDTHASSSATGDDHDTSAYRTKRARRPRKSGGGRARNSSKLAKLAAAVAVLTFAATGLLPDRWWEQACLWAVDTANTNCIDTAYEKVLCKSTADIQCLQETRLKTDSTLKAAQRKMGTLGWNAIGSIARTTEAGKGSGGCVTACRKGIGITPTDNDLIANDSVHRISAAHVNAIAPGGLHVIAVYLKDTDGLSEYKLRVLQGAAALARTLGGPWLVAGDWNVPPHVLQNAAWLKVAKGTIYATQLTTCNDHTYNYFVVSHCLGPAVVGVQRLDDGAMYPHHPSRLILRGENCRRAVRKLKRAARIPAVLPFGPPARPPCYKHVADLLKVEGGTGRAMTEWYKAARDEWTALADTKFSYDEHSFQWESPVGPKSRNSTSALAGAWREAARRASDVVRLNRQAEKGALDAAQLDALKGHSAAISNISSRLPAGVPSDLKTELDNWAEHYERARKSDNRKTILQLTNLADIKGKKMEEAQKLEKMNDWRIAIGATAATSGAMTPTRLAYRWLKGLTGWTRSPIGLTALTTAYRANLTPTTRMTGYLGQAKPTATPTKAPSKFRPFAGPRVLHQCVTKRWWRTRPTSGGNYGASMTSI